MNRFSIIKPTYLGLAFVLLATVTGCIAGTAGESDDTTTSDLVSSLPNDYASSDTADDSAGGNHAINAPAGSYTNIANERSVSNDGDNQGPHPDPWVPTAGPHPDPWSSSSGGSASNSSSSSGSSGKR